MPTLYDMIVRHALYFEGARRGSSRDFAKIVRQLDAEILRIFQRTGVDNFGEMTKADFNRFVARIRRAVDKVLTRGGTEFTRTMRELADIETSIYQRMFRANTGKRKRAPNRDDVWSRLRNREIGANGGTMTKAARQFRNSTMNAIERVVRQGYADKKAVQEVLSGIRGLSSLGYRNGVLSKISRWSESYFDTMFQHVGLGVRDELARKYYETYIWLSTLDEGTTDICRSRHMNRYRYGEGPIPPAHYECRSETIPDDPEADAFPSFNDWLTRQPDKFLSDAFHKGPRRDLDSVRLITLDKLKDKLGSILSD